MRVKVRWIAALLVGVWVIVTVLYLAPLFWAVQEEKVVRVKPACVVESCTVESFPSHESSVARLFSRLLIYESV